MSTATSAIQLRASYSQNRPPRGERLELSVLRVEGQQRREAQPERPVGLAPIEALGLLVGDGLQLRAVAHRLARLHPVHQALDRDVQLVGAAVDEDAVPVDDLGGAGRVGRQAQARRVAEVREPHDEPTARRPARRPSGRRPAGVASCAGAAASGRRRARPARRPAACAAPRRRRRRRRAAGGPSGCRRRPRGSRVRHCRP